MERYSEPPKHRLEVDPINIFAVIKDTLKSKGVALQQRYTDVLNSNGTAMQQRYMLESFEPSAHVGKAPRTSLRERMTGLATAPIRKLGSLSLHSERTFDDDPDRRKKIITRSIVGAVIVGVASWDVYAATHKPTEDFNSEPTEQPDYVHTHVRSGEDLADIVDRLTSEKNMPKLQEHDAISTYVVKHGVSKLNAMEVATHLANGAVEYRDEGSQWTTMYTTPLVMSEGEQIRINSRDFRRDLNQVIKPAELLQ